jgi:hypothetical protein
MCIEFACRLERELAAANARANPSKELIRINMALVKERDELRDGLLAAESRLREVAAEEYRKNWLAFQDLTGEQCMDVALQIVQRWKEDSTRYKKLFEAEVHLAVWWAKEKDKLESRLREVKEQVREARRDVAECRYWRNVNQLIMTRKDPVDGLSHADRLAEIRQSISLPLDLDKIVAPQVSTAAMVDRFLRWPLPESVCSDSCVTKQQPGRTGINLLTASEAKEMLEYVLAAGREDAK